MKMTHTHRTKWLSLMAIVSLTLPSGALEDREFHSADKKQSFTAALLDYNPSKKSVTVVMKGGGEKIFSLDLLSKEDQAYVKANADVLEVAREVRVTFKEVKGETTRTKKGLIRRRSTPTGYAISVSNRSDRILKNVKVKYSFYYCVGSSSATGARHTPKVKTGTLDYPKMFEKYTETRKTPVVVLIHESKKGVSPPVSGGG